MPSNEESPVRVLHVDDDPSFLEISKQILTDMSGGFDIENACCVDEAFKKLSTRQYDVVISDYEMPKKDGLQFLTELREQNNDIPFMFFTGKGREEVAIKALNLDAEGYHYKQGSPETVYRELSYSIYLAVDRRKAKLAIAESEKRYRALMEKASECEKQAALIDLSPDAIIVKKLNERITFWNTGAEKLYGYTKEEALGQKINILLKTKHSKSYDDIITQLRQGKSWIGEINHYTKNNHKVIVQSYWSATLDAQSGIVEILESNVDITQRKHAEEALKESEKKSRAIVANAPIGIATTGADKHFLSTNEAFCKIIGYTQDELRKLTFKDITHPEDLKESAMKMGELERGRIASFTLEKRYVKKGGTVINGKIMVSAVRNQNGKPSLFVAELEDITERKKAEEHRKVLERKVNNYSKHLKCMVDLRTVQLKDANERLKTYQQKKTQQTPGSLTCTHTRNCLLGRLEPLLYWTNKSA